jgi:hypothetical protein
VRAALALLLAVAVALPAQAQQREVLEVQTGTLLLVDSSHRAVVGGLYLPSESARDAAREVAQLRSENAQLRRATMDAGSPTAVSVLALVAALIGVGVGFTLAQIGR